MASNNAQLEFLTLIGIILNSFMQGFVCINSVYVYFIESLSKQSHPSIDDEDGYQKHESFEYYSSRMQNTLQ